MKMKEEDAQWTWFEYYPLMTSSLNLALRNPFILGHDYNSDGPSHLFSFWTEAILCAHQVQKGKHLINQIISEKKVYIAKLNGTLPSNI